MGSNGGALYAVLVPLIAFHRKRELNANLSWPVADSDNWGILLASEQALE
jgi:hypothetical protein